METDPFTGEEIDTTGEVQSLYVMLALFMSEPQLFVAVIRNTFKPEDKFLVAEIAPFIKLNEIGELFSLTTTFCLEETPVANA